MRPGTLRGARRLIVVPSSPRAGNQLKAFEEIFANVLFVGGEVADAAFEATVAQMQH